MIHHNTQYHQLTPSTVATMLLSSSWFSRFSGSGCNTSRDSPRTEGNELRVLLLDNDSRSRLIDSSVMLDIDREKLCRLLINLKREFSLLAALKLPLNFFFKVSSIPDLFSERTPEGSEGFRFSRRRSPKLNLALLESVFSLFKSLILWYILSEVCSFDSELHRWLVPNWELFESDSQAIAPRSRRKKFNFFIISLFLYTVIIAVEGSLEPSRHWLRFLSYLYMGKTFF